MSSFNPNRRIRRAGKWRVEFFPSLKRGSFFLLSAGACFAALALAISAATFASGELPPSVPPPRTINFPMPAMQTLANGMKVVVVERHSLPLVTLRLTIPAGARSDDLPGEAQLVASLLTEGTTRRSALEIADAIDGDGGEIDAGADWDESYISLSVLNDYTGLAFDLVSDMARNPEFAPAEIERQKKQTLSALEVSRGDPSYLADTVFNDLVFAGTSYGHPADGTVDSIRRITAKDLRKFHRDYYQPSRAILAVVGDISTPEAFALAEKSFGDWQEGNNPSSISSHRALAPASGKRSRQIVVIDKPDAVQTEIRIGNTGIPRDSADYDALTVANQILGGPATNRLFKALRTESGLTYGASSDLVCHLANGSWEAKTSTRTSETMRSIRVILDQMKNLRDVPISQPELDTARSYLTGHLALKFETADNIAAGVIDLMVHGLPLDYWNRFPEEIRGLQTDGILNATRQYLEPKEDIIVLVGNAEVFSKPLKKLGRVQIIPADRVDFDSPDFIGPARAGLRPSEGEKNYGDSMRRLLSTSSAKIVETAIAARSSH